MSTEPARNAPEARSGHRTGMLELRPETSSVPLARRFVRDVLADDHDGAVVESAELCVSELVTNAVLHARTEVQVLVEDLGEAVRLEVRDRSTVVPRRLVHSVRSTTGRGMELVALLARSWGVDLLDEHTKSVWCEVSTSAPASRPGATDEVLATWSGDEDLLVGVSDDVAPPVVTGAPQAAGSPDPARSPSRTPGGPDRTTVVLVGYPVRLGLRAREHSAALLRECALLSLGGEGGSSAPARLLELAARVTAAFSGELAEVDQQRSDALARGEHTTDLRYPAVPGTEHIIASWRQIMGELDAWAAGGTLLTQVTPPDLVRLREWTAEEFLGQLDGRRPRPWDGPLA